ncbi:MAG: putative CDP-diacylglycerol--glycerol-3-phosphate 3-phosphatidyl-transferase 2, partial [Alphaproteobacteria bacterium MarineAlpha6_Bin4]
MKIKFKYLPNILTVSRLISCPILIYLFYSYPDLLKNNILTLIILIIFLTACITDFLDGYLARNYNLESRLGKVLDPIADKALIITISILLIIYAKDLPQLPFFIIMLREIIV